MEREILSAHMIGGIAMKVRDLMSKPVIRIHADEPVSVAARTLTHYNTIGAVCQ